MQFWSEYVSMTCYLITYTLSSVFNYLIPYEKLFNNHLILNNVYFWLLMICASPQMMEIKLKVKVKCDISGYPRGKKMGNV